MNYVIYLHRNKINNKVYVGQTHKNPEKRYGKNGKNYKGSVKFYNAIQRYGWDNFEHIILETGLSKTEANEREKFYIKKYNSIENGYNMTEGGEGGVPSEEVRNKISKKAKERFGSKEYCDKMKEIRTDENYRKKLSEMMHSEKYQKILKNASLGSNNGMYGKHHTEESKRKMREYHKNNPRKGVDSWNYGKHLSEETKRKIGEKSKGRKSANAKQVFCTETKEKFQSATECAKKLNLNYSSVRYCCQQNEKNNNSNKSINGYHLYYIKAELATLLD